MRVMAREVGVDERPSHYRREVLGRADRLENRLAVALQIRSHVPDARFHKLAHSISMSEVLLDLTARHTVARWIFAARASLPPASSEGGPSGGLRSGR